MFIVDLGATDYATGKTIRMIMIELRMFSYNFAYTIMSDLNQKVKRIKTKLLFNEKSTNY